MKLVLAALEWSYEAKATDVQVAYLERAAALLVLRHDTFRIIDGEGPGTGTDQASGDRERCRERGICRAECSPKRGAIVSIASPRTDDAGTIPEERGVAICHVGQLHVFWDCSHCPPAF